MSIIGGIMLFLAGVATGSGAVILYWHGIRKHTAGLRRENSDLKANAWRDRMEYETGKAYRRGYSAGRRNPLSDVERFADTLANRHIDFRYGKRGETVEQEEDG